MEAQSLSTCAQCGKTFQRKAHLLRHEQQHSEDRPYACRFCSKTFKRSDVLRDHFNRCERRGSSPIPSSLERGRKRHACDECSRLKVKCDNNTPCQKCTEFGRRCVKSRTAGVSSPEATQSTAPSTPDPNSDRNSINFLLNLSGGTDFLREFPKSTTLRPKQNSGAQDDPSSSTSLVGGSELHGEAISGRRNPDQQVDDVVDANNLDVFLRNLEFQTFEQQTHNWQKPGENVASWPGHQGNFVNRVALEQRAFEIRNELKSTAVTLCQPHPPSKEVLEALQLMTADKIAASVKLYFNHWHKHGPMIHETTFSPCTAALPLVLSVIGLGGMYSSDAGDVARLRCLLDTMEAYIYSLPGLSPEYELPDRLFVRQGDEALPEWQQYQLEELQGAYLMIVLQYWTGNPTARTRVRQQRFTRYVSLFHHHGMESVQHSPSYKIRDQPSFEAWIRKESYIRMATLSVMLDNAFGIFNNVLPRFQWSELDLPFPNDDNFFGLSNHDEMIRTSSCPRPSMKIKDAYLRIFSSGQVAESQLRPLRNGNTTALDMQMLVHFLYRNMWAATFSNPLAALPGTSISALVAPFKIAMRNWYRIWDEIRTSAGEAEWNKLGFQRTAETYLGAIQAALEVFERKEGKIPPISSDVMKGAHLKRLLSL